MSMVPKMADVADEANVSTSTVSMVFRNDPTIPAQTVTRVIEAAEKLGYKRLRRNFASKKVLNIVVGFVSSLKKHITLNPTIIELIHGIEEEAKERDISILIRSLGFDTAIPDPNVLDLPREIDRPSSGMILLDSPKYYKVRRKYLPTSFWS